MEQIKLKQAEFETLKHQNTVKNDQNKQILVKSLNQKLSNEKEKLQINTQEKLREVAVQSNIMLENTKKEIAQRVELDHQRKLNK